MNCHKVQQHLEAYLDGELAPEAEMALKGHLRGCRECAADLAERRALLALLDDLEPAPLPADFTATLLQRLDSEAAAGQSLLWPWLRLRWSGQQFASLTYAVCAASCLALAGTMLQRWGQQSDVVTGWADRFQLYWLDLSATVTITGTWLSQVW